MKKLIAIAASIALVVSSCESQKCGYTVEVAYPSQDIIGEGVTWMPESEKLVWVDIWQGVLHELDQKTGNHTEHKFQDNMVSTVTPYKGDTVLLSLIGEIVLYDMKSKTTTKISNLVPEMVGYRPNDGKCSPEGRFWVGIMKIENYDETGGLYVLNQDLTLRKALDKQIIPNGIVWNKKGDKMYYIDSARSVVEEYEYNQADGEIKFLRTVVKIPTEQGLPDGLTIDDQDNLWVALWGGYGVNKYSVETGELMDRIEVGVPNVATCTFGGKNQDILYINSARSGLSAEELEKYPLSGSLFKVKLDKGVKRYNHHAFVKE